MKSREKPLRAARARDIVILAARIVLAFFVVVLVVGGLTKLVTDGLPWAIARVDAWKESRLLNRFSGMQLQRHVDAASATHEPYRFVIDKCIAPDVGHIIMTTLYACRGNVRVLAGNDEMLGRGNIAFADLSNGEVSQIRIEFGDSFDLFDVNEVRER